MCLPPQFRHKVRFEGMELPPSRSSSTSDCKSLCLPPLDTPEAPPTPDSVDCGSEASWRPASSSPCSLVEAPGLGLGLSLGVVVGGQTWREHAETEATLRRILPAFDTLLLQLDRVTQATEELYRTECRLEKFQRKSRGLRHTGQDSAGQRKHSRGANVSQTKERRRSHTETSRRPHNLCASDRVHRKSEKSSHKTDKVSHKGDTSAKGLQHDLLPKDSSPQRTDRSHQKAQASSEQTEAHASKTEKNSQKGPKVDSSPVKAEDVAVKAEASAGTVETAARKTAKGPRRQVSNIPKDAEAAGCASKPVPPPTPLPTPNSAPSTAPGSAIATPVPIPRALEWFPPSNSQELPSSLFHHPAHTTTIPTRKRKHKPPPLKNKVHPNTDKPISGYPKP